MSPICVHAKVNQEGTLAHETLGPINSTCVVFGRRIKAAITGEMQEISFLFQRFSLIVQRFKLLLSSISTEAIVSTMLTMNREVNSSKLFYRRGFHTSVPLIKESNIK